MAGNNTTHFFGFDKAVACLNADNFTALTTQASDFTFLNDVNAQIISRTGLAPRHSIMTGGTTTPLQKPAHNRIAD